MTTWAERTRALLDARGPAHLVATDLDGTLLRRGGVVSARTEAALDVAHEAGLPVVFVTARPPRWVDEVAGLVRGHDGVVLCANGAFVYDVRTGAIIAERLLSGDAARALIADLRAGVPGISFALEDRGGFALEPGYRTDYPVPHGARRGWAEELVEAGAGKLLARHPDLDPEEFLGLVAEVIGERAVLAFSGAVGLAEISAPGVTKAAALTRYADIYGVDPAGAWAFGDMPNDLPMLAWAGVGVAVGNAHHLLQAAADLVAPSNDEDGVAAVLELLVEAARRGGEQAPADESPQELAAEW